MSAIRLAGWVVVAALVPITFCDYLDPGYMKFGIPAAWDKPFSTKSSYDLNEGVTNTIECAIRESLPTALKPSSWFSIGEPKTCKQLKREAKENGTDS